MLQFKDEEDHKRCSKCKEVKPLSQFAKNAERIRSNCKSCCSAYGKIYRVNGPIGRVIHKNENETKSERFRRWSLKKRFNLTVHQYQEMLDAQKGLCAICGKPEAGFNQYGPIPLSVDHDHCTGNVRALLCRRCNTFIGKLETSEVLSEALEYLEKYS